jgi:hypothetical protein
MPHKADYSALATSTGLFILSLVPPVSLGFIRDNRGGALVIGGNTGSITPATVNHGGPSSPRLRGSAIFRSMLASHQRLIPTDWSPPTLDEKDSYLVRRIQNGEI